MNPFLLYLVKAALSIAALYVVYLLFLGRDTMYERNRFFILLSFCASLIFPLIIIETRQPIDIQFFGKDLTGVIIYENPDLLLNPGSGVSPDRWNSIILKIYLAGLMVFGIRLVAEFLSLIYLITRQNSREDNIIWLKNYRTSGFSAFGYIFIDTRLNNEVAAEIIKHEQKHLRNYHFLDILLIEVLKAVQWFNPFIYLFDRSLREVHEFQADEECINSGITVKRYQGLLLNQVFKTNVFNASDSFSNRTIIKKRMIMMTRKRSRTFSNLKILMTVPVVTVLLISFSTSSTSENPASAITDSGYITETFTPLPPPPVSNVVQDISPVAVNQNKAAAQTETQPFVVAEKMPLFPGGDSELLKYISDHTIYPETAKAGSIAGRVIVRFCVTETGGVNKITVLKGADPALDAEAVRVVSSLPAFVPGNQEGVAVPVWYMVPVTFSLQGNENLPLPPPPPSTVISEVPEEKFPLVEENPIQSKGPSTLALVAEEMPIYPGGDAALLKYIARNSRYPGEAKASGKEGRVTVRFCITESGGVDMVSILKGVDPALDAEAMRVVSTLSGFKPAMQGGKPVPVWYAVPITFTII